MSSADVWKYRDSVLGHEDCLAANSKSTGPPQKSANDRICWIDSAVRPTSAEWQNADVDGQWLLLWVYNCPSSTAEQFHEYKVLTNALQSGDVGADSHELMIPHYGMRLSIAHLNRQLDCGLQLVDIPLRSYYSFPISLKAGGWVDLKLATCSRLLAKWPMVRIEL